MSMMSKCIPTLNNRGYQMSTPSPLLHDWISSYDGQHPLLDIGCAYGINTFEALELGIPTVSLDPEERHLEILRLNVNPKYSHMSTCVIGELPENISFADNYFSGILCAEVMHFLDGRSIEKSIDIIYRKLVPKGKFVMTMASDKVLGYIDQERYNKFSKDLDSGIKWPGEIHMDDDFMMKFKSIIDSDEFRLEVDYIFGNFIHYCSLKQLTDVLKNRGFVVLNSKLGGHNGYPDPNGMKKLSERNLLIVAQKN